MDRTHKQEQETRTQEHEQEMTQCNVWFKQQKINADCSDMLIRLAVANDSGCQWQG